MTGRTKLKIAGITLGVFLILGLIIFFRFFFTYEQRNIFQRKIGSITGLNMTVTIFGYDGRIIKRWKNVQKITTGRAIDGSSQRHYTYFYTKEDKYVQIPNSVWYVAEEE